MSERAGRVEEALASLSQYYETRARSDRQVRSALVYPAVMLVLMLVFFIYFPTTKIGLWNHPQAYFSA